MAQILLSDVSVTIGTVTIPANGVKSVKVNDLTPTLDNSGMGHTAKSRRMGFPDWSMEIEIYQDFADDGLDEDLWTIRAAGGSAGAVAVLPASGGVSATNPSYESTASFLEDYTPIDAPEVGALGVVKIKLSAKGALLERHVA